MAKKLQLVGKNADKTGMVTVMKKCPKCGCRLMADGDVMVCPKDQNLVKPLPGVLYKTLDDEPTYKQIKKPLAGCTTNI